MLILWSRTHSRRIHTIIHLILVLFFLAGATAPSAPVSAANPDPLPVPEFAPGRVLVKLKEGPLPAGEIQPAAASDLDRLQARSEVTSVQPLFAGAFSAPQLATELGLERIYLLELHNDLDPFSVIDSLAADPSVEYAEPDYILKTAVQPNDQYFPLQWGLHNTGQVILGSAGRIDADIDLPEAFDISKGSPDIIIAIVDTGVSLTHPDLVSKLVPGYNIVDGNSNPQDNNGHGTHVAGIAAAATNNNNIGISGVCWECKIMPLKALGTSSGSTSDVAAAIRYAADHDAHVINLSLGGPSGTDTLLSAVRYAYLKNIPIVAAMMNEGNGDTYYPAAYPETIAVGATDKFDLRADYSNYGSHIDLVAPGSDILSTHILSPYYYYMSGTSMATPHVAGVLGLMRSMSPSRTIEDLRSILRASADDLGASGWDIYYGAGRLNAYRALQLTANAITSVSLRGPYTVKPAVAATFTARVSPTNAATPITYTWTATGQSPNRTFTTNSLTNQTTYTWTTPGLKTVRVTASNLGSTRTTTIIIAVGLPVFMPSLNNRLDIGTSSLQSFP
jgi:subtilisin family serine protease